MIEYDGINYRNESQPLPEGEYEFRITKAIESTTDKGSTQIKLHLSPVCPKWMYHEVHHFITLCSNKARIHLGSLIDAMGQDPTSKFQLDVEKLIGNRLRAVISNEEYKGWSYPRVRRFIPKFTASDADGLADSASAAS